MVIAADSYGIGIGYGMENNISILMSFFYWQGFFPTDSQPRHTGINAALSGSHSDREEYCTLRMKIEAIISLSFDQISARETSCRYKKLVSIECILLLRK
jgi:hypothetical protein